MNRAEIHVTFPDGLVGSWKTHGEAPASHDAIALGRFLMSVGQQIFDMAGGNVLDGCIDTPPGTREELAVRSLALQLWLVDEYNMSPTETSTVLSMALADTIAYSLKEGGSVERLMDGIRDAIINLAKFRLAHPAPPGGLAGILDSYRRADGKVRPS